MRGPLGSPEAREDWKASLAAPLAGRKAILGFGPLAGLTKRVTLVRSHGGPPPLVLSSGTGAGPLPPEGEAVVCDVAPPAVDLMTDDLRRLDRYLREDLPAHGLAAIEEFDPQHEAVWLVNPFVDTEPLHGRPVLGGRPRAWLLLEDKTTVDALFDTAGVAHAPLALAPVDRKALDEVHARLDTGAGTVWSGDARDGFNGGGEYVRWVVTEEDRAAAMEFFTPRCDEVRVVPFLDGVPCSIHGCVLPDGTATFRPLELAILRGAGRRFVYGGQGTTWDPPAEDVEAMREVARRVGEGLRDIVGYRGFFGIDGVLTPDGFRPTEVNTRFSGGVSSLASVLDPEAFDLLQITLVAGADPFVGVAQLEEWALPALDHERFVKAIAIGHLVDGSVPEPRELPVRWDGTDLLPREPDEPGWLVEVGPTSIGAFIRLVPPAPPTGLRAADLNCALMRFADAEIGTAFGPVEPAPDVRTT